MDGCFDYIIYGDQVCAVPKEARRRHWILWDPVCVGDQNWVLQKTSQCS